MLAGCNLGCNDVTGARPLYLLMPLISSKSARWQNRISKVNHESQM